ncbi:hypothetical protein Esti_004279 [Eimeria stiedai]
MDRSTPAAAPSPRGRCWKWLRAVRKSFVCIVLFLLLAAQVGGAIHMRGSPGVELLVAALTPGIVLLFVLQWLAGPYRLKWCVALEQVGMGAVLSVLLAVGLELLSAILFGSNLRACTPPPNPKAPFAAASPHAYDLMQQQEPALSPAEVAFVSQTHVDKQGGMEGNAFLSFFKGLLDAQLVGCGFRSRGVARHLLSYVAGGTYSTVGPRYPSGHVYKEAAYSEAHTYVCIGFIFAYMIFCIGFAEEFSKASSMLLMRPSQLPSRRVLNTVDPGSLSAFKELAEKEDNSVFHFVSHPTSFVVAGCCGALGFATIENLSYVFATKSDMDMALATAWVRAFTAIPSHVADTGIAACLLATAAAHAVAAASSGSLSGGEAAAAAEQGEAGYLQDGGRMSLRVVGEARAVDVTSSSSENTSGAFTPPNAAPARKCINPFSFRKLLRSALVPGLLHGCYDAALTLASAAYTGGALEGNAVIASCWLMIALVSWWTTVLTFCNQWCRTKRFADFYVYFSGLQFFGASQISVGAPFSRPSSVVPGPGQFYLADPQQQQQQLQQQLLHQQFAPIHGDVAAWQQYPQQLQRQQISTPMYRQYAPVLYPPQQQQRQEASN